jgi:hypothetical protein
VTAKAGRCPCGSHLPAIGVKGRTNDILNFKILDERTVRGRAYMRQRYGQKMRTSAAHFNPFCTLPTRKVGTRIVTYTTITEDTPEMEVGYGGATLYMRAGN